MENLHSNDVERAIIGSMFLDHECIPVVLNACEGLFYNPRNALVIKAIDNLFAINIDPENSAEEYRNRVTQPLEGSRALKNDSFH